MPKNFRKYAFSSNALNCDTVSANRKEGIALASVAKVVATLLSTLVIVLFTYYKIQDKTRDQSYAVSGQDVHSSSILMRELLSNRLLHRYPREAENDDCYSNLTVTSVGGTITSPGFPNNYPSNQDCRWLLTAPDESHIILKISTLNLELARDCDLDYLQIYNGTSTLSTSLGLFCGKIKDHVIRSNSTKVLIAFHSDPSYEEKGFSLDYHIESLADCQTTLTASSGVVSSPQFPDNYPDNSDCWTLISVTEDKIIVLQFDLLDLEYDENCTYDYVEVLDGPSNDALSLGRFCSNNQKSAIQSTTNSLLLHFKSDHLINKKGFRAQYTTTLQAQQPADLSELGGCLWDSDSTNGTIASPNYPEKYPSNSYCNIILTAPVGNIITLTFDSLQLEVEANCSYDYVAVKDGFMKDSLLLGRFCGKFNETKELTSSQNTLQVTFNSDDFAEFSGFKARYNFQNLAKENVKSVTPDSVSHPTSVAPPVTSMGEEDNFIESPQNATLPSGGSYILPCVSNIAGAKIRWLKDEQFLGGRTPLQGLKMVANNTLWIQSMNRLLVGVYTCAAVTPENRVFYARAWITMERGSTPNDESCNIVLRKTPKDASFSEGEFSYMECLASGAQTELSWEKDGLPLEIKSHITVLKNGFIFFDKAVVEDSGVYTCVISDRNLGCEKRVDAVLTVSKKVNVNEICGRPKVGQPTKDKPHLDHGKIVGGHNTRKGAYPWQVMFWEPQLKAFCGGTLLNERWIVTAAHCFKTYKDLRWNQIIIKLGKHNREEIEDEEIQTGIGDPSSIIFHPAFNINTFDNDIALVRLRDHVRFTNYILPVCLGQQQLTEKLFQDFELKMGTVTGWGKLKEKGASPKFLQEIRLPIVNQETCVNSTNYMVTRNMFCAGYAQAVIGDACQGDSGGPFVMESEGKWYIAGIVSWGEGCGKEGKYGFYTRISNYLPWIRGIMKS